MKYDKGVEVVAPDYSGDVRRGVIVDNLSVMCYIKFHDNGDEVFVYKVDRNFKESK